LKHCPWCEEYVKSYLKDDGVLTKVEIQEDGERIDNGFWASIKQVNNEQFLANKALSVEEALKRRMPVQIDMRNGGAFFGRFWCYSLAEERDKVSKEALEHLWILSGGCSMSWMTPICCELANATDTVEQISWEIENFAALEDLTHKLEKSLEKEQ
jgi:hypothetical protein